MSALEIMRVLVVSTAHLTKDEAATLERGGMVGEELASPLTWEYGWIFYVGGCDAHTLEGWHDGFKGVVRTAWANGLEWVRFDTDGPELDDVPTYDW